MRIDVFCETCVENSIGYSTDEIEQYSKLIFSYILKNCELDSVFSENNIIFDVNICDNAFIQDINKIYRDIDKPTDVITFSLFVDSEDKLIIDNTIRLGQILISEEKIKEQSLENNVSFEYEFLNLLSHGILHLLGYDHQTEESLVKMLDIQQKAIEEVYNVKI